MENMIVAIIILIAAIYVGRRFYRRIWKKEACDCACTCCSTADSCGDAERGEGIMEQMPKAADPEKSDP